MQNVRDEIADEDIDLQAETTAVAEANAIYRESEVLTKKQKKIVH